MIERPATRASELGTPAEWHNTHLPDSLEHLVRHPELQNEKSHILALAFDEFISRSNSGETLIPSTFCEHFPALRRSLLRMINLHSWVHQKPKLARAIDGAMWPQTGAPFLSFKVIEEIGRGAFARVYLARQPDLGDRYVVLKVALGGGSEAKMMGRMSHPNIVPVYSVVRDDTTELFVMCMPYLGEATLSDVLDGVFMQADVPTRAAGILPIVRRFAKLDVLTESQRVADPRIARGDYIGAVAHLASQLAEALDHAHQRGILHRDLKPSNILMSPAGRPMLLDFNLSSDAERDAIRLGGTLPYMCPEQLNATVVTPNPEAPADARWDVFSLGVIMYEMLTHRLPFGNTSTEEAPEDTAQRILQRQQRGCRPVREFNPLVPRGFAQLVSRCMATDPEQRPPTAEVLAQLLRKHVMPVAELRRWVRRRRMLVAAAGSGVAVASGAAIGLVTNRDPLAVRLYRAGVRAYQANNTAVARDYFSRASRANTFEPHLALGQMLALNDDHLVAIKEFNRSLQLLRELWTKSLREPELTDWQPEIVRCMGTAASWLVFCYDSIGGWIPAEYFAVQAIDEYAVYDKAIWANRGWRALEAKHWARAIDYCSRAIVLDDQCRPAYYTRALAQYRWCWDEPEQVALCGASAVFDIEQTIHMGPCDAPLYLHAARIHALCDKQPTASTQVRQYVQRALDAGADRRAILTDASIAPMLDKLTRDYPQSDDPGRVVVQRVVRPEPHFPVHFSPASG